MFSKNPAAEFLEVPAFLERPGFFGVPFDFGGFWEWSWKREEVSGMVEASKLNF